MTYEAYYYAADGHAGSQDDGKIIETGSIDLCRSAIAFYIGPYADEPSCRWNGTGDDIEAYHESPREGCGGYAIREAA